MRNSGVQAEFKQRWNGPRWRWWSLIAGLLLLLATAVIGGLVALVLDQDVTAFIMLLMILEILGISMVGSGLLDSATRTMNRGGLAREGADIDARRPSAREIYSGDPDDLVRIPRRGGDQGPASRSEREDELKRLRERDQEERDRRTIRSALIVLPIFVTFVIMLFQL